MARISRLLPKIPKQKPKVLSITLFGRAKAESLEEQVASILAEFNGSLLLSGPDGVLRYGFQPGNYVESTGQTLTPVDSAVGLVLDAAQQPGPELAPAMGDWVLSVDPSIVKDGNDIVFTAAPTGQSASIALPISGKMLNVSFEIVGWSGGLVQIRTLGGTTLTSSVTHSGNGVKTEKFQAVAGNTTLSIRAATAFTGRIRLASVRELPGIHGVQPTTQFKPLLRADGLEFDGVDDRIPLPVPPLLSTDDYYQLFALKVITSAANKTFADLLTNPTTGTRLGCLRVTAANNLQVVHANDGGGVQTVSGSVLSDGQKIIVEAVRAGNAHTVYEDGVSTIATTLSGAFTVTHATLGARGQGTSEPYRGFMQIVIICKGVPSEEQRNILRTFAANWQGRSL